MPEEDFSYWAQKRREAERTRDEVFAVQDALSTATDVGTGRNLNPQNALPASMYREQAASMMATMLARQKQTQHGGLLRYPTIMRALAGAVASGAELDIKDITRLVNYAEVHSAAQLYVAAPDDRRRQNILMTAGPVMRMAILDDVAAIAGDYLDTVETADGNMIVDAATWVAGTLMKPFEIANETTQHAFRAGLYDLNNGSIAGNYARGVLYPSSAAVGIFENWDATERGQFNQEYLNTLKASGKYDPLAVDIMSDIARAQAAGDADPIISTLEKYNGVKGADTIIRQLIYRAEANPELMELGRQIDSANTGSTGQLYTTTFTSPDQSEYSEFRGYQARETASGAASVFYAFTLDPTILGAKMVGAYRAGRYALSKLAPGQSAAAALASKKIAGVESNSARRYINSFTAALTKLDDLEKAGDAKAVASFRDVMMNHYKEFPEEVIEEFRTQGIRSTDDFARFIDDTNDMSLLMKGDPASWANQLSVGVVNPKVADSMLVEMPFYERLYSAGDMGRRAALMPRMTPVRSLREGAVRAISASFLTPSKRSNAVIKAAYGDDVNPEVVAEALDQRALGIGVMDQGTGMTTAMDGSLGRRIDGFTRLFSSLPNKGYLYTGDARDAKTFYKFARSFLTRRHAEFLTESFRQANPGQRRLMVAGVIRSAAGARGVNLDKAEVLARIDDLATGSKVGERYSAGRTLRGGAMPDAPAGATSVLDEVEGTVVYRPSSVDGHEHALHLWQTTNAVHIPSIRELEQLKAWRDIMPSMTGKHGDVYSLANAPQRITDAWSLGTLYGLRFAMRSAVEDMWAYAVTAGTLPFLYRGRRASTAVREATANTRYRRYAEDGAGHKKGELVLDEDGNAQIVVSSRLGMMAKQARKVGDAADDNSRLGRLLHVFFLENLDEEEVVAASLAQRAGDSRPVEALMIKAMARLRLSGLDDQAMRDIADLAGTPFGMKHLEDIAEASRFMQSGMYPTLDEGVEAGVGMASKVVPDDAKTTLGAFIDVAEDGRKPWFNMFWFRNIEGVIEHDGVIGKIAVARIYNRRDAIEGVAAAIRNDTKFGYKDMFSALYTKQMTIDEFAQRYVDDVQTMFSNTDGHLNHDLINKVAPKTDGGFREASLYDDVDGEKVLRITPQTMRQFKAGGAPEYVLGREAIPMPDTHEALFDKAWGWMGEQYARIAREPVFLANYQEQREMLRAYEKSLAEKIGPEKASKHAAGMAADRAYGFTLSYVDNPTNRSQLAWKVRNVSRYYRATEDFYRRMFRTAKNHPEAFWKTALTYQVLSDSGFVYTDDNGDKYFAYPGNEMLQQVVSTLIQPILGTDSMEIDPFFMGGKVKMLAPSSDVNQLAPTVMGPMAVMGARFIFDKFPQMAAFERYVVGEYGMQSEWYEALLPAAAARVFKTLSTDERESVYGNAVMDAFAIAVAEGLIPEVSDEGVPIESVDQFKQTSTWSAIQRIAWGGVITRGLMGFVVPASPQMYVDNVTDYARAHGLDSMRDGFLDLVSKHDGDIGQAYREWWSLHPEGDLMPFTVSKTMDDPGQINSLAEVQSVAGLRLWYKQNKALYEKYPNAALFLAPREGEFSWGSWDVISSTLGLKVGKDFNTFMQDALSSKTRSRHYATYDDFQRDIDALDAGTEEGRAAIRALEDRRKFVLDWLADGDPFWKKSKAESSDWDSLQVYAEIALRDTRTMVNDLKERGANTPESDAIRSAIYTFEDYMVDIRAIEGSTTAEDEYKSSLYTQLTADLEGVASRSPNARVFVDNVLYRTPEMAGRR